MNGHSTENDARPSWAYHSMPKPPEGFAACRVGWNPQTTHLVILDSTGSNGGRPTLCRLTRFPTRGTDGETLIEADLPGWSMGGGVSGPGVEQIECPDCYGRLGQFVSLARVTPPGAPKGDDLEPRNPPIGSAETRVIPSTETSAS